ncbi:MULTISPECIES: hypothetical protein [unclassified Mycolicibacterium]|uniref:hypothetical protein n=1 Tax=unclassified Mycolicibacterium TaxID=2636767 RepID=UPI0012DCA63C|nr:MULTISPECIES: hypothetical protein [unclassified Mycolicibacterium]MUL84737.1 hypothetical protein [Mycolicibacterium sp. CBMA 329]MUL88512.1 hypothetical protein [Mycolicibacterium sp. CBMA 331]MUM00149.1 hypothetical protein [Mycolicibacterium sp. CBMA 334]MUM27813.1 hypothetical protein [Mycolicibacterium sp. CBMA 295]MUM40159.1 hypothetical protein [Mycolicibacterium sp. CBMA 247]
MTVVHFEAGERRVVFVKSPGPYHDVYCNVGARTGSGTHAVIANFDDSLSVYGWNAVFTVTADQAADYAVTCEGKASDKFGVGGDVSPMMAIGGVLMIIAGAFICTLAMGIAIATAIVARRRNG